MKKNISHKKLAGIVGILAIGALLLAGTFAWYSGMNAVNEFIGTPADKEVVLHDDYDPETGDKAVYAENGGKGSMFIRIRLDEFMDLNTNVPVSAIDWTTHIPGAELENCGFSNDELKLFHNYFTWTLGGQKYYLPGIPGTVSQDLKDYTPGSDDYNALSPVEQALVRQTPSAQIIPMAEYKGYTTPQKEAFAGWIYDTDGYAYWSRPLFSGQATGMLLEKVDTSAAIKDEQEYYYAINVIVQAVDYMDLAMWLEGKSSVADSTAFYDEATPDAKDMLRLIRLIKESVDETKVVIDLQIETPPDKTAYTAGELFDRTGLSLKVYYADGSDSVITSGFSYSPANTLSESHTEITFKYGGKTAVQAITVDP